MKKVLLTALCFTLFGAFCEVNAQELTQNRRRVATYTPGSLSNPVRNFRKPARSNRHARTVVFKYDEGVTTLNEAQKQRLLLITNRIAEGRTNEVQVIAASKTEGDATKRAIVIETFLKGYERNFSYVVRYIDPINIVSGQNNTIKIIER